MIVSARYDFELYFVFVATWQYNQKLNITKNVFIGMYKIETCGFE